MSGPDDFHRLRDLLGDACEGASSEPAGERSEVTSGKDKRGRRGRVAVGSRSDPAQAIAEEWAEVVGDDVAANTTPVHFRNGRLVVSTSSSVWAQTLQFMGQDLVESLNERVGEGTVREVVFRHAGWEERPRSDQVDGPNKAAPRTSEGRLTEEQKAALAGLEELDLPEDVRERIAQAMKASFVRGGQGFVR